jgi:hypothetical protein
MIREDDEGLLQEYEDGREKREGCADDGRDDSRFLSDGR